MISMAASGLVESVSASGVNGIDVGRGAIAGAFIFAAAFLAGYAAIRRSGLAVSALVMVLGAAALEFSWLGFLPAFGAEGVVMTQALFAAAAIIFLSASIGAARYNPVLGGVMFTAALIIGGMGLLNFFDRVDLAPAMRFAMIAVGGFAAVLALSQALRGDMGARLILPGIAIAAIAPFFGPLGSMEGAGFALAPHGVFTLGILAASLVALTEGAAPRRSDSVFAFDGEPSQAFSGHGRPTAHHGGDANARRTKEREEIVLDSQIARVLDYSGVAVWDWAPDKIDQTDSLPTLLGSDSQGLFTPEALRNFIHPDDAQRFEDEVIAPIDGPFDVSLKLYDERMARIRGARAANEDTGVLERLVAFFETGVAAPMRSSENGVDGEIVKRATAAAIVPSVSSLLAGKLADALDRGDITAAFQPIQSLDDNKIAGYEALARWNDQDDGAEEGPETFVRAAEAAGRGNDLARLMLDNAAMYLSEKIKSEKSKKIFTALNVTWRQISDPTFAGAVRDAIQKYDLPRGSLVLELTEADAIGDAQQATPIFKDLKNAGAALAFDDFGAGFTCLSNLRKFDFDYLKIDKSFASDLETGGDGAKIVAALARLGDDLGLKVIVEGVETKAAAKSAKKLGCSFAQGYAFGHPVGSIALAGHDRNDERVQDVEAVETAPVASLDDASDVEAEPQAPVDKAKILARMRGEDVDVRLPVEEAEIEPAVEDSQPIDDPAADNDRAMQPANDEELALTADMARHDDDLDEKTGRWRLWGNRKK